MRVISLHVNRSTTYEQCRAVGRGRADPDRRVVPGGLRPPAQSVLLTPVFELVRCVASSSGRCHVFERTSPLMPHQPTAAGATPPSRAAGTRYTGFFRPRFAARRHIDLHRVSSAICQA